MQDAVAVRRPWPLRLTRMKFHPFLLLAFAAPFALAQTCPSGVTVQSGAKIPRVIELYTSEGCSSCPPADRWLTSMRNQPGVITASFHVDYWNGQGWTDRFASRAFTERQKQGIGVNGSRFAYTPQLVFNGRDSRDAAFTPEPNEAAKIRLTWTRSSAQELILRAEAQSGAPSKVAIWWARLEDGHQTQVHAGENRGAALRHDSVVREYAALPPLEGRTKAQWTIPVSEAEPGHPTRWIAVAVNGLTGKVLQALEIGC